MSEEAEKSINNSLELCLHNIETGRYAAALELLKECEQRSRTENIPVLINISLILKSRALAGNAPNIEALAVLEESLSFSSSLFMEDPVSTQNHELIYGSIRGLEGFLLDTLHNQNGKSIRTIVKNKYRVHIPLFMEIYNNYTRIIENNSIEFEQLVDYVLIMEVIITIFNLLQETLQLEDVIKNTLKTYEKILQSNPEYIEKIENVLLIAERNGNACIQINASDKATAPYLQALAIIRNAFDTYPENTEIRELLTKSHFEAMTFFSEIKAKDIAQSCLMDLHNNIEQKMQKEPNSKHFQLMDAMALIHMGHIAYETKSQEKAKEYCTQALSKLDFLLKINPEDILDHTEACTALEKVGFLCVRLNTVHEAEAVFGHSIKIRRHLVDSNTSPLENMHIIAMSYMNLGDLCKNNLDPNGGKLYYEEAISTYNQILQIDPDDTSSELRIAESLSSIGTLFDSENLNVKGEYFEMALEIYDNFDITSENFLPSFYSDYASIAKNLSQVYEEQGEITKSLLLLQKASEQLCIRMTPVDENWKNALMFASLSSSMAKASMLNNDKENAEKINATSIEIFSSLLHSTILDNAIIESISGEIEQCALGMVNGRILSFSLPYFKILHDYYISILKEHPHDNDISKKMITVGQLLVNVYEETGDKKTTLETCRNHIEILEDILRTSPENICLLSNLRFVYNHLSDHYYDNDQIEEAEQALDKAGMIKEQIIKAMPTFQFSPTDEYIHAHKKMQIIIRKTNQAKDPK
jgi:tetratricopeptide (TPR) repeat protein